MIISSKQLFSVLNNCLLKYYLLLFMTGRKNIDQQNSKS